MGAFALWALAAVCLLSLRGIAPPFTAVQAERRVQAWIHKKPYHKRYAFAGLDLALFAAEGSIAKALAPEAVRPLVGFGGIPVNQKHARHA